MLEKNRGADLKGHLGLTNKREKICLCVDLCFGFENKMASIAQKISLLQPKPIDPSKCDQDKSLYWQCQLGTMNSSFLEKASVGYAEFVANTIVQEWWKSTGCAMFDDDFVEFVNARIE